ncbi:MAG: hypothetical protein ACPF8V_07905, partial [Luteibaculum sp.]
MSSFLVFGQSFSDPYEFSGSSVTGTARFSSMGGAFSALGGDGSAISLNPAGAAVFLNNRIDGSLAISSVGLGILDSTSFATSLNMPAFNVVFTSPVANSPWKTVNFGLATNRQRLLDRELSYRSDFNYQNSQNPGNSLVGFFLNRAQGFTAADLESLTADPYAEAAYYAFVINPDTNNPGNYTSPALGPGQQEIKLTQGGRISDYEIFVSGNYNNRFYLGASIGVSTLDLDEQFIATESYQDSSLREVELTENAEHLGASLAFKIGGIVRLTESLRVSA